MASDFPADPADFRGCKTQMYNVDFNLPDLVPKPIVLGFWLLAFGFRLLAFGFWLKTFPQIPLIFADVKRRFLLSGSDSQARNFGFWLWASGFGLLALGFWL